MYRLSTYGFIIEAWRNGQVNPVGKTTLSGFPYPNVSVGVANAYRTATMEDHDPVDRILCTSARPRSCEEYGTIGPADDPGQSRSYRAHICIQPKNIKASPAR